MFFSYQAFNIKPFQKNALTKLFFFIFFHPNDRSFAWTPSGGDCDLVSPMSTIKGKGHWGEVEGLEKVMWLRGAARAFVNDAHNYRRVQVAFPRSLSVSKSHVTPRLRPSVSRRSA